MKKKRSVAMTKRLIEKEEARGELWRWVSRVNTHTRIKHAVASANNPERGPTGGRRVSQALNEAFPSFTIFSTQKRVRESETAMRAALARA